MARIPQLDWPESRMSREVARVRRRPTAQGPPNLQQHCQGHLVGGSRCSFSAGASSGWHGEMGGGLQLGAGTEHLSGVIGWGGESGSVGRRRGGPSLGQPDLHPVPKRVWKGSGPEHPPCPPPKPSPSRRRRREQERRPGRQSKGRGGWCSLEGWKAAQGTRTKFILNHTPRSSQLIAELETIRELPNYCQLERANQAPSPTPRPALTTKCQTSLEADALAPARLLPDGPARGRGRAAGWMGPWRSAPGALLQPLGLTRLWGVWGDRWLPVFLKSRGVAPGESGPQGPLGVRRPFILAGQGECGAGLYHQDRNYGGGGPWAQGCRGGAEPAKRWPSAMGTKGLAKVYPTHSHSPQHH